MKCYKWPTPNGITQMNDKKGKRRIYSKESSSPWASLHTVSFCIEAEAAKVIISYNSNPIQVCCPLVGSALGKELRLLIKQDFRVFEIGAIF